MYRFHLRYAFISAGAEWSWLDREQSGFEMGLLVNLATICLRTPAKGFRGKGLGF